MRVGVGGSTRGQGDPDVYVRGIGTVLEQTIKGGDERNALISVTHQR